MELPVNIDVPPIVLQASMRAAAAHGVDVRLLLGLAWVESRFAPQAVSARGARGVFQIMPSVARQHGIDPSNVEASAELAAYLLAHWKRVLGSDQSALAAYVWGPANVKAKPASAQWPEHVRQYTENVRRAGNATRIPLDIETVIVRQHNWRGAPSFLSGYLRKARQAAAHNLGKVTLTHG